MTDYWETIRDRLHEESGLHHPSNKMGELFNVFFNGMLNQFSEDNMLFLDQGFIVTASGLYLDIRGHEIGLPRKEGEYASGSVIFTLTREVPETETPQKLENEEENGVVHDYRPSQIQTIIDEINTTRLEDNEYDTLIEARPAVNKFTIPQGMTVYSDVGFEYTLQEDVTFEKGDYFVEGLIKAKESGARYNAEIGTVNIFDSNQVNKDLIVMNTNLVKGGSDGESDAEYGQRLLNNESTNISVNYLKKQGITIYTKNDLSDDIRTKMTSFNPYLFNEYALIPPNNEVADYTLNELIVNEWTVVYIRGW